MAEQSQNKAPASSIGDLGERLVAQWLQSNGWIVLHRRFSCRLGEIDIIAQKNGDWGMGKKNLPLPTLIFVEVKTRSPNSWDNGGREAIASRKQAKICRTAQVYLAKYPNKADYICRFDVAIAFCQRLPTPDTKQPAIATMSTLEYLLTLEEYIESAFDCE